MLECSYCTRAVRRATRLSTTSPNLLRICPIKESLFDLDLTTTEALPRMVLIADIRIDLEKKYAKE